MRYRKTKFDSYEIGFTGSQFKIHQVPLSRYWFSYRVDSDSRHLQLFKVNVCPEYMFA